MNDRSYSDGESGTKAHAHLYVNTLHSFSSVENENYDRSITRMRVTHCYTAQFL